MRSKTSIALLIFSYLAFSASIAVGEPVTTEFLKAELPVELKAALINANTKQEQYNYKALFKDIMWMCTILFSAAMLFERSDRWLSFYKGSEVVACPECEHRVTGSPLLHLCSRESNPDHVPFYLKYTVVTRGNNLYPVFDLALYSSDEQKDNFIARCGRAWKKAQG